MTARLKGAQKRLADLHAQIPFRIAKMLARKYGRRHLDDLTGIACDQYVRMAGGFDPARSWNGEAGFGPYIVKWLPPTVNERFIRRVLRRPATLSLDMPPPDEDDGPPLHTILPRREEPPCFAEAREVIAGASSVLGGKVLSAFLLYHRDGMKMKDVAMVIGCTPSNIYWLLRDAIQALQGTS